jgi:hypothetical protein
MPKYLLAGLPLAVVVVSVLACLWYWRDRRRLLVGWEEVASKEHMEKEDLAEFPGRTMVEGVLNSLQRQGELSQWSTCVIGMLSDGPQQAFGVVRLTKAKYITVARGTVDTTGFHVEISLLPAASSYLPTATGFSGFSPLDPSDPPEYFTAGWQEPLVSAVGRAFAANGWLEDVPLFIWFDFRKIVQADLEHAKTYTGAPEWLGIVTFPEWGYVGFSYFTDPPAGPGYAAMAWDGWVNRETYEVKVYEEAHY